ncbi:MAG: hypothetical protein ABSH05_27465, partial [Bryobacteraceae bacterium]
ICQHVRSDARYRHTRVVLLAGLLEPVDETEAERVKADGILKKPFEASVMLATLRPLIEAARLAREVLGGQAAPVVEEPAPAVPAEPPPPQPEPAAEIDPECVRAAVTLALDQVTPALIDQLTERVLVALKR